MCKGEDRLAFVIVAKTGDTEPGTISVHQVNGTRVALCNVNGRSYAIDDVCTHDGGPLDQGELEGDLVECPRHGARFDVTTGKAVVLPAVKPVKTYPVQVEGDAVMVDVG
jgi:3-phenylpropionate/trans-cinnamate dioxygenase ferredoxin subunit